jgi:hypothetical protein
MPPDSTEHSQACPARPHRFWPWVKRGLIVLAILLGLSVIFHAPLLRWVLDKGGSYAAQKLGYDLEWQVGGSVVRDLGLQGLSVRAPWGKVKLENAGVRYDLWKAWREGLGSLLKEISLSDAEIELDMRTKPDAPLKAVAPNKENSTPPDIWVKRIDLRNVNLKIMQDDGELLLRGLTLLIDPQEPGVLEIKELSLPGGRLQLKDVRGKTQVEGRALTFAELQVLPDLVISSLTVDTAKLQEGLISYQLEAKSGEGRLTSQGNVAGLGSKLDLDLSLAIQQLAHTEVTRWAALPAGLAWKIDEAKLSVKGSPAKPKSLDSALQVQVSGLQVQGYQADRLNLSLSSKDGVMQVQPVIVQAGPNQIEVTATAQLPDEWAEVAQSKVEAQWKLQAPELATVQGLPFSIAGSLQGVGKFLLQHGKLISAEVNLDGTKLKVPQLELASLQAKVITEGEVLKLQSLTAKLDEAAQNQASVSGELKLTGQQETQVQWQVVLQDLAALMPLMKLRDTAPPDSGIVRSQGTASFSLTDLKAKNYQQVIAAGNATLEALQWQEAKLEGAKAEFSLRDGIGDLQTLNLRFDEKNQFNASATIPLDQTQPFSVKLVGALEQLPALSGWLKLAKAPAIESGSLQLDWHSTGVLASKDIDGGGSLKLENLKLQDKPDRLALRLEVKHAGKKAELTNLQASAGKFRAELQASISETELLLPKLTVFSNDLKLVEGHMRVPLILNATPRPAIPVARDQPLDIHLDMEKLNFTQLAQAIGMKLPVQGEGTAKVDFQGTLADLQGQALIKLTEVRTAALQSKLEPASLNLEVKLAKDRVALNAVATQKPLQPLSVKAEAACDLEKLLADPKLMKDTPLQASVSLPPSSLETLPKFIPDLKTLKGQVALEAKISGTVSQPQWAGLLQADVSEIDIKNMVMDTKDVKAHLSFTGNKILLDDVSAMVSGGTVKVLGSVDAANLKDPTFDLKLQASEALLVRDSTMSFRANADLSLQGTLAKSALKGRVDLVRGRVFKEIEYLPLSLPNQLPPAPPPVRVKNAAPPTAPALLKDWTFDVAIATRDPVRLLGNVLNGGVLVNLQAGGTGAAPSLVGKVSLDGARLRLPFSRLSITRGDVLFTKENPFQPTLDLQGDSLVGNYLVTLYGYGSALAPKLRFTSSPPLPEAEIATLLATGSTAGDLRSSEGVAANRAAFLLLSQTYRKLFNQTAPRRQQEEAPRLSFSFNPLSTGTSQRSVTATYELSPKVQAVGTFSENGGFRGLLYYLVRFR